MSNTANFENFMTAFLTAFQDRLIAIINYIAPMVFTVLSSLQENLNSTDFGTWNPKSCIWTLVVMCLAYVVLKFLNVFVGILVRIFKFYCLLGVLFICYSLFLGNGLQGYGEGYKYASSNRDYDFGGQWKN